MFLLSSRSLPQCGDWTLSSVLPPMEGRSSPINTPGPPGPQFLHPTNYVVLYILFYWPGTPVSYQLMFCKHFCVWRCILDMSLDREACHIHHLVHLKFWLLEMTDMGNNVKSLGKLLFFFFHAYWYKPGNGIAGSYGKLMFNFLRSIQTVFYHGCSILYSHKQAMKVQIFSPPHHTCSCLFSH